MSEDIDLLREQIATLQAKVAELENMQGRKSIPAPREPQTTIFHPVAPVVSDLPNDRELQALRDLCRREFPAWCDSDGYYWSGRRVETPKEKNEAAWLSMLASSLLAISQMWMLDKPDKKYFVSHFVDLAGDVLRKIGKPASELRTAPFTLACLVMRVPVSGVGVPGVSVSIGFSEYNIGKPVEPGHGVRPSMPVGCPRNLRLSEGPQSRARFAFMGRGIEFRRVFVRGG
jgi:hypothetical protein